MDSQNKEASPENRMSSAQALSPQTFKRNIAFKFRIGELAEGKQILNGERLHHLDINNKQVARINIIANVVDKYMQEGEKPFGSITLDDATGQIKIKAFGEDLHKLQNLNLGDTLMVIGLLRVWNNEVYITPEIIKKKTTQYLLIRKLEREKALPKQMSSEEKVVLKEKMLSLIKDSESIGGIEVEKIILESKESPQTINQEIKHLLEEGMIYEPRPGKLRYLGS
jgi:RPA family protein